MWPIADYSTAHAGSYTLFRSQVFFFVHGPGHKYFGYVRRLVTGEEAEMVLDFNEKDQYLDGES